MVDAAVDALELHSPESGFPWYRLSKLVNLRHIAHHTAQLADRLRATEGIGLRWVGARPGAARRITKHYEAATLARGREPGGRR